MDARNGGFFSDHLGHRRVKSGFIYDYDIEGNIRMILHFYPDTRHIAFISDNSYGGVAMQALGQGGNEEISRTRSDIIGRAFQYDL